MKHIDIVFDGPPGPEAPGFVEVEDEAGRSISIGEWVQRPDGYWVLRLTNQGNDADVLDFQRKFGVPMAPRPAFLERSAYDFRLKFMEEELEEFVVAHEGGDLAGAADALVDLVYVVLGTALMMGLPWPLLWNEVQRANMTKERAQSAAQSKRGSTLDVIKPPGWAPPDHAKALGTGLAVEFDPVTGTTRQLNQGA